MTRETIGTAIDILWVVFWIYWLVSATQAKRTVRRNQRGILIRLMIAVVIIFVIFASGASFRNFIINEPLTNSVALMAFGVLLTVLGIAFAIWARVHLGKNWGMPMTLKEGPELITSGPYRLVRHPIYSGILLAMLGSAIVGGVFWLLVIVLFGIYFIYAAKGEEKIMSEEFPNQYPEYMKHSKMLIPWVL